jgi:cysteine desulfurase
VERRERIYLDYAATAPIRDEVVAVMLPLLRSANPSSVHADGRAARAVVDAARDEVARVLGAGGREIVFTGSGTEADVLAVLGAARAGSARGRHLVVSAIEHSAVLLAAAILEGEGWTVARLPVTANGVVEPATLAAALRDDTVLVSVMLANNELGTIQPVAALAALAHARGAVVHTDAVQAAGYLDLDVAALGVDLLSLASHKLGGPKGVGALYVRRGISLAAVVPGSQEHGVRGGTENVAGIAGFARALVLAAAERPAAAARVAEIREGFERSLLAGDPGAVVLGHNVGRLPHVTDVLFPGVGNEALLVALDLEGVSASAGSACAAGSVEPSHVVAALGIPEEQARSVVRFSFGRHSTAFEAERAAGMTVKAVRRMRMTV